MALGTLCGGIFLAVPAQAQSNADPAVMVCQATGLIALKQRESYISDLVLSMDSLPVSTAETKIEDVPVKTVILGEATIKHDDDARKCGKPYRVVCLIGYKGKVLLTFFTTKCSISVLRPARAPCRHGLARA